MSYTTLRAVTHDLPVHEQVSRPPMLRAVPVPATVEELPVATSWAKRGLDIALTVAVAPIVLPLVGVLIAATKIASPGPAFYSQRRLGRNGRIFSMYKFRSMVTNGDDVLKRHLQDNPDARAEWARTMKLRNDPRVTRLGRFLRRSSLDELPQLWNVLRGDMSLVGPRPIVSAEQERYGEAMHYYLRVRPGLTGVWQVSGRSDVLYPDRVKMDRDYVSRWSLRTDLGILARTFGAVVSGRGAY